VAGRLSSPGLRVARLRGRSNRRVVTPRRRRRTNRPRQARAPGSKLARAGRDARRRGLVRARVGRGPGRRALAIGLGGLHPPSAELIGGVAVAATALTLVARRLPRLRRVVSEVGRGLAVLREPRRFLRRVLPWQIAGRLLRLASLGCFLLAFGLPAAPAVILAASITQGSGRMLSIPGAGTAAAAGAAHLAVSPLARGLSRPAKHRAGHLADRHPDLRPVPGGAAPARRGGHSGHGQRAGGGCAHRAFDNPLQPTRCGTKPPCRRRSGDRDCALHRLRTPWAKALALLWGPTVALAVVATGNHYVFDIAAGLLVTVAGFGAARVSSRLFPCAYSPGSGARRPFAIGAACGGEAVVRSYGRHGGSS
jgi:hypothetical protein